MFNAGLVPEEACVYRMGREGCWSGSQTCATDDPEAGVLTFAYLGDVQPGSESRGFCWDMEMACPAGKTPWRAGRGR